MKTVRRSSKAQRPALLSVLALSLCVPCAAISAQAPDSARIAAAAERVVAARRSAATASPGCAVGVSSRGLPVYLGAYGMADLESGITNSPATIFESGSVAKQFVAASIVLLAIEGKLGLDEPARKYVPELPDYGTPLTIRHLLTHTGGVRDWGAVMGLTGVGRGQRVISQAVALDVTVRQRALDFTPGAEYSYSNSGYTLLTEIVERISKQSLMDFTAERFFTPLGMTQSSWRDDYQRLVRGRAQAYSLSSSGWRLEMPFMNVYGNGGMLTTVGDWLKWNAALDARTFGAALVDSLERRGVLNDGAQIPYALGVIVDQRGPHRTVSHGGSTGGYQTFLTRYPDLGLSIAVLCNGASLNATTLANAIADEILGPVEASPAPPRPTMSAEERARQTRTWRHVRTHMPLRTIAPAPVDYVAATPWDPASSELAELTGTWHSEEADATFVAVIEDGALVLRQRAGTRIQLTPFDRDHFGPRQGGGITVWFTRDAAGRPSVMHVGTGRARDVPFVR